MLRSFGQRSRSTSAKARRCGRYSPRLEALETRLAPATLVNPNTVTYRDFDNDLVTVTIDKPVFQVTTINSVFDFSPDGVDGNNSQKQQLDLLNLTGLAAQGATLTLTTKSGFLAEIGRINATGLDLAALKLNARVAEVDAGDGDLNTPALGLFKAMELTGLSATSNILGDVNVLKIKVGIGGAFLNISGSVETAVVGELRSEAAANTGRLSIGGNLGSILIEHSISGGAANGGVLDVGGNIGLATVLEDLRGGSGDGSGRITAGGDIGTLIITGEVFQHPAHDGDNAALINAEGSIGKVKIGRDVTGSDGIRTGCILATGSIQVVKIGGSVIGGNGVESGRVAAGGSIGKVALSGNLNAGNGNLSGMIGAEITIGEVFIGGTVAGLAGRPARIVVQGFNNPTDPAIGLVTILGNMIGGQILAGYDPTTLLPEDADQRIGKVKIGFSFQQSLIAAGVDPQAGGLFADANDTVFDEPPNGPGGDEPPISRIDKVVISSAVGGTATAGDHFGIVALAVAATATARRISASSAMGPTNQCPSATM